jgi:hypothetical protein
MIDLKPLFVCGFWSTFYWITAIGVSVFWGLYGIMEEAYKGVSSQEVEKVIVEQEGKRTEITKTFTRYSLEILNLKNAFEYLGLVYSMGAFISDFIWSFIGWCSLYLLLSQYDCVELVTLNVFLGIVAIVGITGYGFQIPDKMKIG